MRLAFRKSVSERVGALGLTIRLDHGENGRRLNRCKAAASLERGLPLNPYHVVPWPVCCGDFARFQINLYHTAIDLGPMGACSSVAAVVVTLMTNINSRPAHAI